MRDESSIYVVILMKEYSSILDMEIRFTVEDDQYEQLKQIKERNGLTWKGMMLQAAKHIDEEGPL